jgi:hypothetical protein
MEWDGFGGRLTAVLLALEVVPFTVETVIVSVLKMVLNSVVVAAPAERAENPDALALGGVPVG